MITNLQTLPAVRCNSRCPDPAIDPAKSDLVQYLKTRSLDHLVALEGQRFTIFHLDPIAYAWLVNVVLSDSLTGAARPIAAFRGSCFRVTLPDGSVLAPSPSQVVTGAEARYTEDSWVKDVSARFGLYTVVELGNLALQRAQLPEDQKSFFA